MEDSYFPEPSALPSLLKRNSDGSYNCVTEGVVKPGDIIEPCFVKAMTVGEIVEQRPAKGEWESTSYKGKEVWFTRFMHSAAAP